MAAIQAQLRLCSLRGILSLSLGFLALIPGLAEAQFLSRDFRQLWANEVFENYGRNGYRDYDFDQENRRFDIFGDLLIDGVDILEYNEVRRDAPGLTGSYETRSGRYEGFFQKLVIADEGFGRWSTRLIIGDHIRTFFTPMTLNLPQFNGVRWDGSSRQSRFSIIATHLRDPLLAPDGMRLEAFTDQRRDFGTSLIGGHWESQIGDLLKIGTTYVNTHRFDGQAGAKVNGLKGDIPRLVQEGGLRKVYVFFSDDAPYDGSAGATVYSMTMYADGEAVAPLRVGKIDFMIERTPVAGKTSKIPLNPNEVHNLRRNRSWLPAVVEASNIHFFQNVLNGITQEVAPASSHAPLQANGTDVVFYEYAVADSARQINFDAVLANDYSVDVIGGVEVPLFNAGTDPEDLFYDWHNPLRAEGQPGNNSNLRQVNFSYGFPTGLSIMGFDFEAQVLGTSIQGELARSTKFLRVPTAGGARHDRQSSTFYVNFLRPLHPKADLGFEWFDVPADYTTEFPVFLDRSYGPTHPPGKSYFPVALVEDNDDLDGWSDSSDPNGVLPGLDLDEDGVLDLNVGPNAFAPFLGYYVEPSELVYGDDFNNNGTADLRENDNLPDYLYPADHRGFHAFVSLEPTARTQVRFGGYRMHQPTLGGDSDTGYIEGKYRRDWEGLGYIALNHRVKWVEDDIPNMVYFFGRYNLRPDLLQDRDSVGRYNLRPDLLQDRDSVDNLTYFEWGLRTVPDLNIRNVLSFNHIDLRGAPLDDPLLAAPGTITHFSMVNKADYTWQRGRFKLMPQIKHIYRRSKFPERLLPDQQALWLMPILRLDYQVGPNTVLKTGAQGFPLLSERVHDPILPEGEEFQRKTYTAFLQNKSNHRGYDLTLLLGGYRSFTSFTGTQRPSFGFVEYFFRVFIG